MADSRTAMWSAAESEVGGRGRALEVPVVAVLYTEAVLGDTGSEVRLEDMLVV